MSNKEVARNIFADALNAVLPQMFMHRYCSLNGDILSFGSSEYDLGSYKNLYLFGSGKAACSMAKEMEELLEDRIYKGLIVTHHCSEELKYTDVKEGSHPIPSQKSIDGATLLKEMMSECDEDDLYIYLLSGGSSSLIEIPIAPITLEDLQICTTLMLSNSLEIHEINAVRKHLSLIKGGRLAHACKATGMVLLISDIIDNALDSIGSAPLYADKSSFTDVKNILDKHELFFKMPSSVQETILKGLKGEIEESPFEPLERVRHNVITSNSHALEAAHQSALSFGLTAKTVEEPMEGDVVEMVEKMLVQINASNEQCLLFGGECTVNLRGDGKGGRNQHAALLMLKEICAKKLSFTFLSASTDGIDGNSPAAGAVVDRASCLKAEGLALNIEEYINCFDSYSFFKTLDDLVVTGPSGTNVIDIAIIIKGD